MKKLILITILTGSALALYAQGNLDEQSASASSSQDSEDTTLSETFATLKKV